MRFLRKFCIPNFKSISKINIRNITNLKIKISTKIIVSYIIVALIAGIVGVIGITNISKIELSDTELYENVTVPIAKLTKLSTQFQVFRAECLELIAEEEPENI